MPTVTILCELWPIVHQVRNIRAAQAGYEVPSRLRRVCRLQSGVQQRKNTELFSRREIAIVCPIAGNIIVAKGHIVEDTRTSHSVPVVGVALRQVGGVGSVSTAVFRGRQVVINRSRIALRTTSLLINKRLDTGKLRSGE